MLGYFKEQKKKISKKKNSHIKITVFLNLKQSDKHQLVIDILLRFLRYSTCRDTFCNPSPRCMGS